MLDNAAQIAIAAWIVVHGVVLLIAGGRLPFDRPALAGIPFGLQVAAPTIGMIEVFPNPVGIRQPQIAAELSSIVAHPYSLL